MRIDCTRELLTGPNGPTIRPHPHPGEQEAIRSLFVTMDSIMPPVVFTEPYMNWLKEIKTLLVDETEMDHTTKMRRNWFVSNIDSLLKRAGQNISASESKGSD